MNRLNSPCLFSVNRWKNNNKKEKKPKKKKKERKKSRTEDVVRVWCTQSLVRCCGKLKTQSSHICHS